jgi:hypothetical protein
MAIFDKNTNIPITCPHCGKKSSKKLGWLQNNPEFPCEGVDCPVVFKTDELLRSLKEANKLWEKTWSNIKKRFE